MTDPLNPTLRAVSDAVLAVGSQLSVDVVLQRLVEAARELAGARYAALGIPDDAGGFRRFLVAGMSDELVAAMGPLPRTHGMLGAMLDQAGPYLTDDIHRDPRFRGWWPRGHPDMRSFLGVPIVARDDVIGAFYLTEKADRERFDETDAEVITLLAAHAAIAITNARLYEQSRELSVVSERNRLALELHDAVSQKLFSLTLTAEAAATRLERDPGAARAQVLRLGELAREALDELRSLLLGLRPPDLERDGLRETVRKELDMFGRVHQIDIELTGDGATGPRPRARSRDPPDRRRGREQRVAARGPAADRRAAGSRTRSRSSTTAAGSIPTTRRCARGTSGSPGWRSGRASWARPYRSRVRPAVARPSAWS